MTSFEKKREEYFKKIKSNKSLLNKTINDNNTEEGKKLLEVLLTPKDEREVETAEILYSMIGDLNNIIDRYSEDELKEIPNEENEGLKAYIRTIVFLKNNEEEKLRFLLKKETPENAAKVMYGFLVATLNNPEETIEYVAEKSGFDLSDDFENAQFQVYLNKAKRIMDDKNLKNKNYRDCTEEEMKQAKILAEEFHKCCEEGKKDLSNETKTEQLARQFTKQ